MKRYFSLFFSILLIVLSPLYLTVNTVSVSATTVTSESNNWPTGPAINAQAAIVMEASTGLILYEKNIHETHYPASITKILSALVNIENSSLNDVITYSRDAIFNVDLDSSRIGIDVGEQITMLQALYGVLLESANEVTYGAAEHTGGDIDTFIQMMNDRAKEIGALNSNFVNPHGLHNENHYTTAYDMALITREAIKNSTLQKIWSTRTYQIPPTNIQEETRYLRNHHRFILKQDYFYDDTTGGKTGYTSKAGYTLVTTAKRGDLELICVIMKDDTFQNQYTDTQKLLDYGFDNFSIYPVGNDKNSVVEESPMFTRYNSLLSNSASPIVPADNGYVILPNSASIQEAKKEITYHNSLTEITEGNHIIGTISYEYAGKYVGGADILYHPMDTPTLVSKYKSPLVPVSSEETNQEVSQEKSSKIEEDEKSGFSIRPLIIGGIIGVILLLLSLYFIFYELPRIRRRNAYYKKKALRKKYRKDDYLNL